jgi:hypothetical protein
VLIKEEFMTQGRTAKGKVYVCPPIAWLGSRWCSDNGHPGTTYNPRSGRTACTCGQVVAEDNTAASPASSRRQELEP